MHPYSLDRVGLMTIEMIVALIFCMSFSNCLYFDIISKVLGGTLQSVGSAYLSLSIFYVFTFTDYIRSISSYNSINVYCKTPIVIYFTDGVWIMLIPFKFDLLIIMFLYYPVDALTNSTWPGYHHHHHHHDYRLLLLLLLLSF